MSALELSSFEEAGERQWGGADSPGIAVPSADELKIGPYRQSTEGSTAGARLPRVDEPSIEPLDDGLGLSKFQQSRHVLVGVVNAASEDRQGAKDHAQGNFEPLEEHQAPAMDAGSGGDKPPIDRSPQDGAADVPEEPEKGDTNRVTEVTSNREVTPRPVEIHHGERQDVVINRRHPDPELIAYAAERLRTEDDPTSWPLQRQTYRSDLYVDSPEEPKLFAKAPRSVNEDGFEEKYITPPEQAAHSVLAQMAMAQKVRDVVSSDEGVQQALEAFGITLDVPQPVAGASDRQTGQKTVVYAWQEGISAAEPRAYAAHTMVEWVAEEVDRALRENGIVPVDHSVRQYLVSATEQGMHLSLTDVEMFHKLAPGERMYIPGKPMLESGEVDDFGSYHAYEDDELSTEGSEQPNVVRVEQNGILAARRNEANVDQSPVLYGQLHGGCIAAVWNRQTGEGGIVHFTPDAMEVEDRDFRMIDELIGTLPTLGEPDSRAWALGARAESESAWFDRDKLAGTFSELGVDDCHVIPTEGVHHVELDLVRGVLIPYDAKGNVLPIDDEPV